MTDPRFDIERIQEDLARRKTKSPRVLTPARRQRSRRLSVALYISLTANIIFMADVLLRVTGWW